MPLPSPRPVCWSSLLLGQLLIEWSTLQQQCLDIVGATSTCWAMGVLTHLLIISHSLWIFQKRSYMMVQWLVLHLLLKSKFPRSSTLTSSLWGIKILLISKCQFIDCHFLDSLLHAPLSD